MMFRAAVHTGNILSLVTEPHTEFICAVRGGPETTSPAPGEVLQSRISSAARPHTAGATCQGWSGSSWGSMGRIWPQAHFLLEHRENIQRCANTLQKTHVECRANGPWLDSAATKRFQSLISLWKKRSRSVPVIFELSNSRTFFPFYLQQLSVSSYKVQATINYKRFYENIVFKKYLPISCVQVGLVFHGEVWLFPEYIMCQLFLQTELWKIMECFL